MSVSLNGTNGLTFADSTTQNTGGYTGFRNRIINGAMTIDQRNAGAAVTLTGSSAWPVDRMLCFGRASGTGITVQRSAVAPVGFTNSLLYTITTGATPVGDDYPSLGQRIEGFNAADLGWGAAGAQTITVSFWARSSVTGTYSFSLANNAQDRSYVAQYTIVAANTWEYKTITIPGDTTGTWLKNNGAGILLAWDMGFGFGSTGTPNTWQAGAFYSVTGNVKLAATSGATFYITGVQLEKGSVATPFEFRPYGTELQLCQRYYEVGGTKAAAVGSTGTVTTTVFKVTKRATPTMTYGNSPQGVATVLPSTSDWTSISENVTYNASGSINYSWAAASEL